MPLAQCRSRLRHPLLRGMLSYGTIWPVSSLAQEYIEHGTPISRADWPRAARFGFFGAFMMAPMWYYWMRYTSRFFPRRSLGSCLRRAVLEQCTFSPATLAFFFFTMGLMESKTLEQSAREVSAKWWPTYKVGAVYWPLAQTLNFYLVPERNRMVFLSLTSLVWTTFMAHVKGGAENRV